LEDYEIKDKLEREKAQKLKPVSMRVIDTT